MRTGVKLARDVGPQHVPVFEGKIEGVFMLGILF